MSQKKDDYPATFAADNFSSTAKLADSKQSINTDDDYNPFEHRDVEHPNTTQGALMHLLKSSLGTGILAMPNAFKNAGLLFGFIGTIVVGFICTYCVYILVKASHIICKRARIPLLGFSETAEAIFEYGPKSVRRFSVAARHIVDLALVSTYLLGDCVYVVFVATNLKQVFDYWFPGNPIDEPTYYMLISFAPLLILSQVRELKHLVPFSFIANVLMIISFAITLYYLFDGVPNPEDRNLFTQFSTLPMFFTTVIFAMEGIGVVMPVENSMAKPQQFLGCPGVLNGAMTFVVILYATIGFFGYLKYGEATEASVTLNLPVDEVPAQLVKVFIAISVFFTYFLQMYVPMDILWRKFIGPRVHGSVNRNLAQVALRCTFVSITVGIAIAVPDLGPIIGLVGAICFSTLGLLIPAVVQTVLLCDIGFGPLYWKLIVNIILAAFSLFVLVSGSIQSIDELINKK